MKGYFITGTDTGVGKTHVSALLVRYLSGMGARVAYYKPVQSGHPSDTEYVARYLPAEHIYSIWSFDRPQPPHRLAKAAKIRLSLDDIKEEYDTIKKMGYDYIIVEGAGGAATPLSSDEVMADIALSLKVQAVIVARGGLGTINHSVLTYDYLIDKGVRVKGFIVNDPDGVDEAAFEANVADIRYHTGAKILATVGHDQDNIDNIRI